MTAMSNYLENELLDHLFTNIGGGAYTAPAAVYLQLHTGDPGEDGTANVATETTRAAIGNMSAASGGSSDNDAAVTISAVSTTEDITHVSLWDASTAGNCLLVGPLAATVNLTAGDDFQIAASDLVVALS